MVRTYTKNGRRYAIVWDDLPKKKDYGETIVLSVFAAAVISAAVAWFLLKKQQE